MADNTEIHPVLCPAEIRRPSNPDEFPANRKWQGIPSVAALPGGKGLVAIWYTGGTTEGPNNYCAIAYSADGGKSWQDPWFVIRHPYGAARCFDPNLWIAPDGTLWVIWNQSWSIRNGHTFDGRGGVWVATCKDPASAEPQWSTPVRIADGIQMNKPITLSNGEWAFPTALWDDLVEYGADMVIADLRDKKGSNITITPDGGKTWEYRGGADIPERCFDEHMIVEKKDHTLWLLARTNYGIGESYSSDMGKTWSPGQKTTISSPNSRFYIGRLASGNLLLIRNVDDPAIDYRKQTWRPRVNMTAQISRDDGKTWEGGLLLDARSTAYPDAHQDENGTIWAVYDHERYKGGHIYLAKFTEDDVLAGKLVSKDSFLQQEISSFPWTEKDPNEIHLTELEKKIQADEAFTLIPPQILPVTDPAFYPENGNFVQSGGFDRTKNGRLWLTWTGGGDNEHAFLLCAYSDDEGKSWTHPLYMIPNTVSPNGFLKSHCCAVMWTDPLGRLWWIFDCRMGSFDGRSGTWCAICENPESDNPVFGTPFRIWHGVSLNRPVVLSDGTWAMFLSLWPRHRIYGFEGQDWPYDSYTGDYTKELDPERKCWMFTSIDQGKSWQRRGGVCAAQREFDEPSFLETDDGTYIMYTRTYYGFARSESTDGGYTWTNPVPAEFLHPAARLFACKLQSGKFLMVRHDRAPGMPGTRDNLTAYLSDDGKNWYGGLRIENRSGVSYPDGFQHPDGRIFVQYDRKRIDGSLCMSVFTEEDVAAGKIVSDRANLAFTMIKTAKYDEVHGNT